MPNEPQLPLDLQKIIDRHAATTQGNWGRLQEMVTCPPQAEYDAAIAKFIQTTLRHAGDWGARPTIKRIAGFCNAGNYISTAEEIANAEFAAHAHQDIPRLAKAVEMLKDALSDLAEVGRDWLKDKPGPLASVIRAETVLEQLFPMIECPACSRAGGADRAVMHEAPACPEPETL